MKLEDIEKAETLEDLVIAVGDEDEAIKVFKAAILAQEKQRVYHKNAYLKRQERVAAINAILKKRGITIDQLLES